MKTGTPILPRFEAAIQTLEAQGARSDGPFHYRLAERWFIRVVSPDSPLKLPVPPMFIPAATPESLADVVPKFLSVQDSLLRCLQKANGLNLKGIKVVSPISSLVRLSLGAYLEGIVGHEEYHWLQLQAVRAHPNFPHGS